MNNAKCYYRQYSVTVNPTATLSILTTVLPGTTHDYPRFIREGAVTWRNWQLRAGIWSWCI